MTSFIIVNKDKDKRIAYASEICQTRSIDPIDRTVLEKEAIKQTSQSIGIEEIKKIQKTLFLKPIKSKIKAVIIEDAQLLTPEAQNALLKVLEEPPAQTIIVLGSASKEALLPTIHSRCQIIMLEDSKKEISEKERTEIITFLINLHEMSLNDRLKTAEQVTKEKEKALLWLEKIILLQRDMLREHPEEYFEIARMRQFQTAFTIIKTTNVNPRLVIEQTLLTL